MPVRKRQQWATAISGVRLSCEPLSEDDAKRRQGQADGCAIFLPEVSDDESPGLPTRAARPNLTKTEVIRNRATAVAAKADGTFGKFASRRSLAYIYCYDLR